MQNQNFAPPKEASTQKIVSKKFRLPQTQWVGPRIRLTQKELDKKAFLKNKFGEKTERVDQIKQLQKSKS